MTQLNTTITILLIFESAQHVSRNHLPIFRNVRLWLQQCGVLSNAVVGWRSGVRWRRLCVRCEGCCSSNIRTIHHIAVTTVLRSWIWAKDCPKHVKLIQRSIKLLLLHLVGHLYRVIRKSLKHFKNSQQIGYAKVHGNSYAYRERNSPSFF